MKRSDSDENRRQILRKLNTQIEEYSTTLEIILQNLRVLHAFVLTK